jgi:hypothetical protein
MQFLQATFNTVTTAHPPPPGGATPSSRYNPHDAIHTAAAYLCDSGLPDGDLHDAVYALQPLEHLRDKRARPGRCLPRPTPRPRRPRRSRQRHRRRPGRNRGQAGGGGPRLYREPTRSALPVGRHGPELTELANSQAQVTGGFDCSGLTKAAYAAADIHIPRTAQTQFRRRPETASWAAGHIRRPGVLRLEPIVGDARGHRDLQHRDDQRSASGSGRAGRTDLEIDLPWCVAARPMRRRRRPGRSSRTRPRPRRVL